MGNYEQGPAGLDTETLRVEALQDEVVDRLSGKSWRIDGRELHPLEEMMIRFAVLETHSIMNEERGEI